MGILDELVGVAVAGDQQDVVPAVARFGGQRGQHVVGLEPLDLDDRDGQLAQQRTDHLELGQEVGRRLRPPRLVVLDHLVPEGFSGQVEGDGQAAGMVVADQVVTSIDVNPWTALVTMPALVARSGGSAK